MIAIVHSIYSQSVHAPALDSRLMDNDAERYCSMCIACGYIIIFYVKIYVNFLGIFQENIHHNAPHFQNFLGAASVIHDNMFSEISQELNTPWP